MATPIPANRARFSAQEVAEATQGVLRGPGDVQTTGVTTDSRALEPGNLFVALRGERFDAHAFLDRALAAGAAAMVIERGAEAPTNACVVEVDDTLVALGALAAQHRRRWKGTLVAITGSAGKTTTKELVAAALGGTGARVFKSAGNLNNRIGVPMTLLQLDESVDLAVIELGTSESGEIGLLAQMSCPDVGVVTLISVAHAEGLGTVEAIAEEKTSLFDHVVAGGHVVFNGDEPLLAARQHRWDKRQCLTFGFSEGCTVRITECTLSPRGTQARFELRAPNDAISLSLSLLGESAALNTAAALAVVLTQDLSLAAASKALCAVKPMAGRMAPLEGRSGALVIDDSYNANPRSTDTALRTAAALAKAQGRRLVVVLGDMLELGSLAQDAHRAVGAKVVVSGAGLFVACGEAMRLAAHATQTAGVETLQVDSSEAAAELLRSHVVASDLVLVKGSRSMQMERVVEAVVSQEAAS